jgi:transcription initiation factor IIE alpha subunit
MPDRPCWYFCRTCAYRGQFVAKPEEEIRCPKCDKAIMRRQDVSDLTKEVKA